MKIHRLLPLLLLALAPMLQAAEAPPAPVAAPTSPDISKMPVKKILFFTKSVTYEHSVIAMRNGQPSFAMQVLKELADKNNLEITESKDGSLFSDAYLAKFDALMFYTQDGQGALTTPGVDKAPPMTAAGKEALLKAVANGMGFIGMHSASDTFHSLPPGSNRVSEYLNNGAANADPYIKMLGGEFIAHDNQQKGHQIVVDAKFPGIASLPADFGPNEEWYSLKNFPADLHVILMQDTKGMTGLPYARDPYPSTWARIQGKGRVFYTSMGHREDVWMSAPFQAVLLGGINWALDRVDADVTPNLDQVAPKANILPVQAPRGAQGARRGAAAVAPGAPGTLKAPVAPAAP